MALHKQQPFNIDALILDAYIYKQLRQVTSLAIFESGTKNFEDNGLFSTSIFGQVGSEARNQTFAYIDLRLNIMHPLIYKQLISIKQLYGDIIIGKKYGKYDGIAGDIVEASSLDGERGLDFILKHIDKIDLKDNGSDERYFKIQLIRDYNKSALLSKWLVLPAGLRDYTVDESGKPSEDEVNSLYRSLIANVNTIRDLNLTEDDKDVILPIKNTIQKTVLAIYDYYLTLLDGKSKFINSKWTKRAITYGTRNVITSMPIDIADIDDPTNIDFNDTLVGLYQYISSISPIARHYVSSVFISRIFSPESDMANLVDKDLLKTVYTNVDTSKRDKWLTTDGIMGIMSKLAQEENRTQPISVDDKHYLLLIYDDGYNIKPIFNTDSDITDDMLPKFIRPITYVELFYLAICRVKDKYPAFVTRYPTASLGGIYPTKLYVKTTVKGRTIKLSMYGVETVITEYPMLKEKFYNSLSPHPTKIAGLAGDFDGDF